jgi:N-acetylmuramoyl-L-alanine amidase
MSTPMIGKTLVTVEQCENFLRKQNSNAPRLASIYKKYCDIYGIRLECIWVQMCLETNFLRYSDTSITTLDMHNYAGLGAVDGNGRRQALSFATEDDGVKCHVQHLYAYCSSNPLTTNETLIDPRFKYVTRGIAPNIENLGNGNWASDKDYATKLLSLLNQLLNNNNIVSQTNSGGNIMSKFAIDPGHGNVNGSLGGDGGAVGYLVEQNCALDIATKVIAKLQSLGNTAFNVRPSSASSVSDSLQKRCDAAANADYLVSIHLNAGGGKGSEIFAMSTAGNALASKVLNELVALGFVNRGVKDGSGLYVIRHSNPVAILIEVCFVDTQTDANLYNQLGAEVIANAIVKGVTGQTVSSAATSTPSTVKTSDAIKALQYDLNIDYNAKLTLTGIADQSTIAALNGIQNIIAKGHKSSVVKWIQQKLIGYGYLAKGKDTGIYDEATFQAVTNMQKNWGRPTDGVLHIETWDIFLNN